MPVQSLRDEKERLLENRFLPAYMATAFLWILSGLDEYRIRTHQQPEPKLTLCLAIIGTGICLIIFRRLIPQFVPINRGECGELRVAEALDHLR